MTRKKPTPKRRQPTREEVAAAARKADFERERHAAEVRAARICLEQTFGLIGQDMPMWGQCAEEMALEGTQRRHEAIVLFVHWGYADDTLRKLVMGEGAFGSHRLTAIWWRCLRAHRVTHDYTGTRTAEENAELLERLCRDVPLLVAEGIMHHDAQTLLCGTEDVFLYARERARREHAEFQRKLMEMAREEG